MATNHVRWVGNINGATEPMTYKGLFQAGSTAAVKRGELLEFTGDSNTAWVPMDSDFEMDGNVAVAAEEIKAGDRAGYYNVYIPRPGDLWEYPLASAAATEYGSALYYSSSEAVTTSGTYVLGYAVGQEHYPDHQGHLADDAGGDAGSTVRSTSYIRMTIRPEASLYSKLVGKANQVNVGDSGGFSGMKFGASGTTLDFYIDGTKVAHLATDGSMNDDVT